MSESLADELERVVADVAAVRDRVRAVAGLREGGSVGAANAERHAALVEKLDELASELRGAYPERTAAAREIELFRRRVR